VFPFLTLYLTRERGLSPGEAGFVVSMFGLGSIASGPVGGTLADRWGRRPTMLVGLVGAASAMLALGFAQEVPLIAALTLALGFLQELYRPAVSAAVADIVPPETRVRAYGYLYWAVNLGFSIGPVIAGFMARVSYLALFAGDAGTTFVYALIVWRRVPETRPADATHERHTTVSGLGAVFGDGVFVVFLALTFLSGLVFQQSWVTLPLDMQRHGISEAWYGGVIALNGVLIVLLQPGAVAIIGRERRTEALTVSAILMGAGFAVNALAGVGAPSIVAFTIGVVIWTLGEIAGAPIGSSFVADLAPTALRGRYQGTYSMSWGVASFAGPWIGMLTLGATGSATVLWIACGALGALVAAGHVASAPSRRARMQEIIRRP
jgi:MFS family permease